MTQLERIKKKLNDLKKIDLDQSEEFCFEAVLSEEEILVFEIKNNLTLPEDYRNFLKEIGSAGNHPFYGLLKLEENDDQLVHLEEEFPFDFENPCLLEKDDELDEKINKAQTEDEKEILWNQKEKLINRDYENATKGITFLCHEGCAMFCVLILKGKAKGSVWWFNFSDGIGVIPIINPQTLKPMSFLDWYEIWVDSYLNLTESFHTYGDFTKFNLMYF